MEQKPSKPGVGKHEKSLGYSRKGLDTENDHSVPSAEALGPHLPGFQLSLHSFSLEVCSKFTGGETEAE